MFLREYNYFENYNLIWSPTGEETKIELTKWKNNRKEQTKKNGNATKGKNDHGKKETALPGLEPACENLLVAW